MEGSSDKNTSLRVASFSCYLDKSKENPVHKISKPPLINPNFSKDTKDALTNLRVDSFSYRNTPPDKFVFNAPAPIQDPTPFTFPQEPRKKGEISIFGADRYFRSTSNNEGPVIMARTGSNHGPRTPSLCSSWNRQTASLCRNGSQTKQKRAIGRRILSGFGCKEPCFDKKDVHIAYHGPKPTRTGSVRVDNSTALKKQQEEEVQVANIEESRTSIEVFGSKTTLKGDVAKNMERKLSILTWDAIPKAQKAPTSTVGNCTVCDDMVSEASSDLFEIENISASIHTSICTSPVSQYAPSEASIQWSVADHYPASDGMSVRVTAGDVVMPQTNGNANGKSSRSRNGGLLGCKSLKAGDVDVKSQAALKY